MAATATVKKASNMAQVKDGPNVVKVEGEIYTSFYCRLQIIADDSFFFLLLSLSFVCPGF